MTCKYLCLDDEDPDIVGPLLDNITDEIEDELIIDHKYPDRFEEQIQLVRDLAEDQEISGLIIDLRLDLTPPSWVSSEASQRLERPKYRAMALAQEIRTQSAEKTFPREIPIVLWSYEDRLRKSYMTDDTGHDLFDVKVKKEDLKDLGKASSTGQKLIALVEGYEAILKTRARKGGPGTQFHKFVNLEDDSLLDPRIVSYFEGHENPIPAHEYARFIIQQLLDVPGPLIDESVLAARLGVSIPNSEDWESLKDVVSSEAGYDGPFAGGWPRWWARRVEQWWGNLKNPPSGLRSLEAEARVNHLKEATGLPGLTAADPIEGHYSTRYWTVCQGTEWPLAPLDPINGLVVDRRDKKLWQDELYISEKHALAGTRRDQGLRIDPLHRARLEELKK